MTLQLLACLFLYFLTAPAIVEIVLEEMWNFINLSSLKPMNLLIFWSSMIISLNSKDQKFQEVFELQTEKYEHQKSILKDLDPIFTVYLGLMVAAIGSIILLLFKKSRDWLFKQLKEYRKSMVWNGILGTIDVCYISYCLQLAKAVQNVDNEDAEQGDKIKCIVEIVIYSIIVFVSQILVIAKLQMSSKEELRSK